MLINVEFAEDKQELKLGGFDPGGQGFDFGIDAKYSPIIVHDVPDYEGQYSATPSQERQVFVTRGMQMLDNFTVDPIPSNYGLIGWNGFTLSVS